MKYLKYVFLSATFGLFAVSGSHGQIPQPASDTDSVSFYLGFLYGKQIARSFPAIDPDVFSAGMIAAVRPSAETAVEEEANRFLQAYFGREQQKINQSYLQEGRKFLAENAKKAGVTTLPDGLQYRVIRQGAGARPQASDEVEVFYHGTLTDGTVFDSAKDRGTPVVLPVAKVIAGFSEALQLMNEGSLWEVFIPAELGYGEHVDPQSGIKPNSVLVFEIDLLRIVKKESNIPQAEPNYMK
ncbi:MAG: FKBP-type peptidyl-prolyl cis-trans isomerase [Bacteroidales bacterium]|nr:FKBP-type peptidyl-prolyl cis-trans isomerase [Bacteroidales bacterium]